MCHASLVFKRLLNQLKWCSERKDLLDCFRRSNFHIFVCRLRDVAALRQASKSLCHLGKCLICLKKMTRSWIDKGDADRHVRQNFFIENNFALDTPRRLGLAPIKSTAKPGKNSCQPH